jgi:hypothetical protein
VRSEGGARLIFVGGDQVGWGGNTKIIHHVCLKIIKLLSSPGIRATHGGLLRAPLTSCHPPPPSPQFDCCVSLCRRPRCAAAIIVVVVFARAIRHPILVWGSPFWFGDPQTKTGIPKPKWGCESQESPNRFGDPRTEMGINTSPYQNGDPRIGLGIFQSRTRIGMGFIPIWDFRFF